MERVRLQWSRIVTTALLGFLPWTVLIPGAFSLRCHSYSSIQPVSGDLISGGFPVAPSMFSICSASQNACVEAHLMLSTEKSAMFVSHRGCASEGLTDEARSSTSGDQYLTIQSRVHHCPSDLCNGEPIDLNAFKMPKQDKASEASSSNQCYSGFALDPDQDILDRVTCGKDSSQCYHGNGTIAVGHLAVDFLIKTCQAPSCTAPESQSFGPIELKLWGSCCRGTFCNGKAVAPQILNNSSTAPTRNATGPRGEGTVTQPTDSPNHDIVNATQDAFVYEYELDSNAGTTTTHNPLYDYEENEDEYLLSVHTNNTLNPRAWNLGPPEPCLSFYLLLAALGIVSLRIW